MPDFRVVADYEPTGDQPEAIRLLSEGMLAGSKHQVLRAQPERARPSPWRRSWSRSSDRRSGPAPNKTLAAQLFAEFKDYLPDNAVEYFVSYYDYYQPEAYMPRSDTYIEKDSSRNEEDHRLRLSATRSLFSRRDVLIVASVSRIYGLGLPEDYGSVVVSLKRGETRKRDRVLRQLNGILYDRNDAALARGTYRCAATWSRYFLPMKSSRFGLSSSPTPSKESSTRLS